jgi:bile acid:Na+ symporter, BASS family
VDRNWRGLLGIAAENASDVSRDKAFGMDRHKSRISEISRFVHEKLIWLLVASYVIAAILPSFGLRIREVSFGEFSFLNETTRASLPMLMLAFLLLNAGLGIQARELRNLLRSPRPLIGGLAVNLVIPVTFIFAVSISMQFWRGEPDEVQNILVGLALIAAMPIAGSSTAWAQNANGDIALSLGLVLFSTLLSPITSPIAFDLVDHMASGEYAVALENLETNSTGFLLIACVLLPSLLGIGLHFLAGSERITKAKPALKLVNSANLLVLNYSNAAVSLPQAVAEHDWDFLAVTLVIAVLMCALAFASGWFVARLLKVDASQRASLMFGLGMNNNGTGLVLASMALTQYPRVVLPVIFYNLIQHLVAGVVDRVWCRELISASNLS